MVPLFSKYPVTFSQYRCQFINSKEELQKKILSDFVDAIIIEENSMLISYRFNGENNIVAADFNAIKNASEDVRKRSKWWRIGDSNS